MFRSASEASKALRRLGYSELGKAVEALMCHAIETGEELDTLLDDLEEQGVGVVESVGTVH